MKNAYGNYGINNETMERNNLFITGVPEWEEKGATVFLNYTWELPKSGERYGHPTLWNLIVPKKFQLKMIFSNTNCNKTNREK